MARIIIQFELLKPTDDVLANHRRAIEAGDMRVLGGPKVELVPNEGYEGPDAPREVYRLRTRSSQRGDRQPGPSIDHESLLSGQGLGQAPDRERRLSSVNNLSGNCS
jgi:hypothetical protein